MTDARRLWEVLGGAALAGAAMILPSGCRAAAAGPSTTAVAPTTTATTGAPTTTPPNTATTATPTTAVAPTTSPSTTVTTASSTSSTCTQQSVLASWSNQRLAMMTLTVPVEESDVGAVTSEVAAGVGGVILFGATAPTNLGSQIYALEQHVPGHLGLLVMTDEEGGGVQRMANLVGNMPWAYQMGKWAPSNIQSLTTSVAKKMIAYRVNVDLAPVVDVDGRNVPPSSTDPDGWRSFSGNTTTVSNDGVAFMKGMIAGHVIPVLKHFPGLGGSSGNTDDGPAQTLPWATLLKVAIPPFVAGIKAGAPAIMLSNATVPNKATFPASMSPAMGQELKSLGFHGLVITDSLTAGAISAAHFTPETAAAQALRAGADVPLLGFPTGGQTVSSMTSGAAAAIVSAVTHGTLARSRLIDAVTHVLAARHVNLC